MRKTNKATITITKSKKNNNNNSSDISIIANKNRKMPQKRWSRKWNVIDSSQNKNTRKTITVMKTRITKLLQ